MVEMVKMKSSKDCLNDFCELKNKKILPLFKELENAKTTEEKKKILRELRFQLNEADLIISDGQTAERRERRKV